MQLHIEHIQFHRNGTDGAPFHAVIFTDSEIGRMLGVVFEEEHHIAIFHLEKLEHGNIRSYVSSCRGDLYDQFLRNAITLGLEMDGLT